VIRERLGFRLALIPLASALLVQAAASRIDTPSRSPFQSSGAAPVTVMAAGSAHCPSLGLGGTDGNDPDHGPHARRSHRSRIRRLFRLVLDQHQGHHGAGLHTHTNTRTRTSAHDWTEMMLHLLGEPVVFWLIPESLATLLGSFAVRDLFPVQEHADGTAPAYTIEARGDTVVYRQTFCFYEEYEADMTIVLEAEDAGTTRCSFWIAMEQDEHCTDEVGDDALDAVVIGVEAGLLRGADKARCGLPVPSYAHEDGWRATSPSMSD
jgi:hypothetical protein